VKFAELGVYGLLTMLLFLGALIAGYFWLYRVGALDWT
jgi:NADH:ubiquinone oxidoreductase subunit 3 (subunit A)